LRWLGRLILVWVVCGVLFWDCCLRFLVMVWVVVLCSGSLFLWACVVGGGLGLFFVGCGVFRLGTFVAVIFGVFLRGLCLVFWWFGGRLPFPGVLCVVLVTAG